MANISIRNLDDSIKAALRRQAAAEHCSMEEFLRRSLAAAVAQAGQTGSIAGQEAAAAADSAAAVTRAAAMAAENRVGPATTAAAPMPAGREGEAPQFAALQGKIIVLIIGGSIAAYKALDLIRLLRRAGALVRVILTAAAQQFITPLLAGALAGGPVYSRLFCREGEPDCAPAFEGGGESRGKAAAALVQAPVSGLNYAPPPVPVFAVSEQDSAEREAGQSEGAPAGRPTALGSGGKARAGEAGCDQAALAAGRPVEINPPGAAGPEGAGSASVAAMHGGRRQGQEIGHIQLARQADLVLVSAATASRLAKMAAGQADDLAGAVLLATRAPVLLAPAMNPAMWAHKATQRNVALLRRDGCHIIGPEYGEMAESGEAGLGRMSEPAAIIAALAALAADRPGSGASRQAYESKAGSGSDCAASAAGAAFPGAGRPEQGAVVNPVCGERGLPAPVSAAADPANLAGGGKAAPTRAGAYAALLAEPALPAATALAGRHIIVTSGPTHEALDPVRYLANRSSGKQGHALAAALAAAGARVTLISGPVALPDPPGAAVVPVTGAEEMRAAVLAALPADAAIFVAAVADWRPQYVFADKIKKPKIRVIAAGRHSRHKTAEPEQAADKGLHIRAGQVTLTLVENPDILAEIGHNAHRPRLVVGFAAETKDLLANAAAKLAKKGADWIIANNVAAAADGSSIMGGDYNHIHILSRDGVEDWPEMSKMQVAARLTTKIAAFFVAPAERQQRQD